MHSHRFISGLEKLFLIKLEMHLESIEGKKTSGGFPIPLMFFCSYLFPGAG